MSQSTRSEDRAKRIALLMYVSHGFLLKVFQGINAYVDSARSWDYRYANACTEVIGIIREWKPDGIIADIHNLELADQLLTLGVPIVNCTIEIPSVKGIAQLSVDDRKVGKLAAAYLIQRGFQHFAYCGETDRYPMVLRGNNFQAALADQGIDCHKYSHWPSGVFQDGYGWQWSGKNKPLLKWLLGLPKPIGIFASHDYIAREVNMACRKENINVPSEVAILGVDDDEVVCLTTHPSLSSIKTPQRRIGFEAGFLLHQMMQGEGTPSEPILLAPTDVITRQSTDFTAIADTEIAQVVQFIRKHADEPIRVTDAIQNIPASRRSLETRFKDQYRRTIFEEIQYNHVTRAKHLLCETDWPIERVAEASGFNNRERLDKVFRQIAGATPAVYRRRMSHDRAVQMDYPPNSVLI